MPEEFDPAWEYYTPDPEIDEAVNSVKVPRGIVILHDPRLNMRYRVTPGVGIRPSFKECKDTFKQLWLLGLTVPVIMEVLSVKAHITIRSWRIRLKLIPRPVGNHSRSKK